MTERLSLKLSSCASRYVTRCLLKHHWNRCWMVGGEAPSAGLLRTRSSMSLNSSNTFVASSDILCTPSRASCVWTESAACRAMPVCLRVREKRVTVLEMLWTSSPSVATSQLTALRMSDSLKPAPATPMIEAITPASVSPEYYASRRGTY